MRREVQREAGSPAGDRGEGWGVGGMGGQRGWGGAELPRLQPLTDPRRRLCWRGCRIPAEQPHKTKRGLGWQGQVVSIIIA